MTFEQLAEEQYMSVQGIQKIVYAGQRKQHGEPPAAMQAVYDYVHEKHIDRAAKIKAMQSQYRSSTD